jgi:antitoxin component YwqK of YwqJK toxin-antitoxin module
MKPVMRIRKLQVNMRVIIKCLIFSLGCLFFSCNKSQCSKNSSVEIFNKTYPPLNYRITGAMIDGEKSGLWTTFDSSGKVETEETYLNGKSFGVAKVYSNGILVIKTFDKIISNDTVSYFEKYNAYGKVITKGQYINGQKRGVWIYYFHNGKDLKNKINYLEKGSQVLFQSPQYSKDDY